jgi:cytochrome c biogenesis protein CcmG/thiol:disulfide interchange protein DsbE
MNQNANNRKSLLKRFAPLGIFLILAGLFLYMLTLMNTGEYNPRDVPTEFIGKPAPEFNLPDLLDQTRMVSTSEFRGKPWLLNVWATWCPECWREHEYLIALAERRGIVIVGLNWRDETEKARQMLANLGNPFARIAVDKESDTVIDWGVYAAPETFLIDAEGIIRVKHKGALNETVWQKKFARHFDAG